MPAPLLSICIPTYNRPELLKRTLESVLSCEEEIEIIVTDNSTNELTKDLVGDFFQLHKVNGWYHKNVFPSDFSGTDLMVENFNMGIKLAKGKFVYVIHDDDFVIKDSGGIKIILNYLREYGDLYSVFKFGIQLVNKKAEKLRNQVPKKNKYLSDVSSLKRLMSNSSFVRFPAMVIKKEAYDTIGVFDRTMKGPTDLDMWSRMFNAYGVFEISEVVSAYTIHPEAETMKTFNESNLKILFEIFDRVEKFEKFKHKEFLKLKSLFFNQFILAGTYRMIRLKKLNDAKTIFKLFKLESVSQLGTPVKFFLTKVAFGFLLFVNPFVRISKTNSKL